MWTVLLYVLMITWDKQRAKTGGGSEYFVSLQSQVSSDQNVHSRS